MEAINVNWELVVAYKHGMLKHPALLQAVQEAIETDPIVSGWYQDLQEDDEPTEVYLPGGRKAYVSEQPVEFALAADSGPARSPELAPVPTIPSHHVDDKTGNVVFTYPASACPYGVARVKVTNDGTTQERLLVFLEATLGTKRVCQSKFNLKKKFGIVLQGKLMPHFYLEFASDENLDQFPEAEVQALSDSCNGNLPEYLAVKKLLTKLRSLKT